MLVFLKDAGQGGRHEGLAESDYIADDDTAAFVEMVSSYLDGGFLKFERRSSMSRGMRNSFRPARASWER